jgi:hypothetical protein
MSIEWASSPICKILFQFTKPLHNGVKPMPVIRLVVKVLPDCLSEEEVRE